MSFFSSLRYYRPRNPPIVTANDLSIVVARLAETGKTTSEGMFGLKVKFGDAIDSDDNETIWYEHSVGSVFQVHEIEWDINIPNLKSIKEVIETLSGNPNTIYRANVFLGTPTPDVLEPITRLDSPENTIHFVPSDLSLEIAPIIIGNLSTEDRVQSGWISLDLSGSGYFYPWSLAEAVSRAGSSTSIKALTDVVQTTWPVPHTPPEPELVEVRGQRPDVWPYDVNRPFDWYWGAHETG